MQKELQQALANLINKTTQGAEYLGQKAVDGAVVATEFLKAEIPEVIKQLLMWEFGYYLVLCLGGLFLTGVCVFLIHKAHKVVHTHGVFGDKINKNDCAPVFLVPVAAWVGSLLSFFSFIYPQLLNLVWLKIWIAPKVYLIQYAANLVK